MILLTKKIIVKRKALKSLSSRVPIYRNEGFFYFKIFSVCLIVFKIFLLSVVVAGRGVE
jgi:hypothetical protein